MSFIPKIEISELPWKLFLFVYNLYLNILSDEVCTAFSLFCLLCKGVGFKQVPEVHGLCFEDFR